LKRALIISPKDNVATALEDISPNDRVEARFGKEAHMLDAREAVPFGFKIALTNIRRGEAVMKYGEAIGKASVDIVKGSMVHTHNLEGARGREDLFKRESG